jgi:hypothetical protein
VIGKVAMANDAKACQPEFSWYAHPLREHAIRGVIGMTIIAGFALFAAILMNSVVWGVLAAGVMVLLLNRFFFPSRFSIDEEGITAWYPLRRARFRWAELRQFVHDRHAGFLSTRAASSRLGARGMHILFGDQRESVIARIERRVAEGART